MTLARRSRSASAWRAIARTMVSFRSTSLISTFDTLMPQVSVCASSVFWMSMLSCSRSASSASSSCLPSTARSVVCASWLVAVRKSATWITAFCGSTTRKYTTAFTFTETLSRVITSCGGTSCTTVRSDTRTMRSIGKNTRAIPGPFAASSSRPRRNTTALSYSFRILMLEISQIATKTITNSIPAPAPDGPMIEPPSRHAAASGYLLHFEHQVLHARDANPGSLPDGPGRPGVPVLAVHEHLALRLQIGQGRPPLPQEPDGAGGRLVPPCLDHERGQDRHDQPRRPRDGHDRPARHTEVRRPRLALEQHQGAEDQADHASDRQGTVTRHLQFQEKHDDPRDHQRHAAPVHGQDLRHQREQQETDGPDHPGRDQARMRELDVEPDDPREQKEERHGRVRQMAEEPVAQRHVQRLDPGPRQVQRLGMSVEAADGLAVQRRDDVALVAADIVDEVQL